jgi:hypothetical protein
MSEGGRFNKASWFSMAAKIWSMTTKASEDTGLWEFTRISAKI